MIQPRQFATYLSDLKDASKEPSSCDLLVQCNDGSLKVPKLLLAAIIKPGSPILDALRDRESCLVMPHLNVKQLELFFQTIFSPGEAVTLNFLVAFDAVDYILPGCVDWERWKHEEKGCTEQKSSEASSKDICGSLLKDIVANLPLPLQTKDINSMSMATQQEHAYPKSFSTTPCDFPLPTASRGKVKCPICGKMLHDSRTLRRHEDSVHLNIRPHGCPHCSKRFSCASGLREHVMAIHERVKAFVCEVCGLALSTRQSLHAHRLVHQENTKSIACSQCGKTFRHVSTFRKHVARVHEMTADKMLKCDHCGKMYNHKEGLKRHVKKFHSTDAHQVSLVRSTL